MKGIILAGGTGSRLHPLTAALNKQLLPVYDKPMIYYPLTTLMLAGLREILVISSPEGMPLFKNLLGDGSQWGIELSYAVQDRPHGLADAFILGRSFIADDSVCLILGDNIFFSQGLTKILEQGALVKKGAVVCACYVKDPQRYGVIEFDEAGRVLSLEEKPELPKSNYVVPGLYFYDNSVVEMAQTLPVSSRGELEITDINRLYLERGELKVVVFGRGSAWLDTGTQEALLEASNFVATLERRQGLKIACPEEVALRKGFIDVAQLKSLIRSMKPCEYAEYLSRIAEETERMDIPVDTEFPRISFVGNI